MAAVVKAKGKSRKPPTLEEEPNQETVSHQYFQSTTRWPSKQGEKPENIIIDVEKSPRVSSQTFAKQGDGGPNGVPYSTEDIEEGEVIGIITLEDVFEELLQVFFALSFSWKNTLLYIMCNCVYIYFVFFS